MDCHGMKMGNVGNEPRLSDLLFSIDMERQHDEVSALLDNLPPDELESSLSNIDLNLFLGDGADLPVDFLAEDVANLSSCDSDEFKNFFNEKRTVKAEPVSPEKNILNRKAKKGFVNKKNCVMKNEILEEERKEEIYSGISPGINVKVEDRIKCEILSDQQNDEGTITHKKKGRKRKNSDYSKKKKKSKLSKNFKLVIKYKDNPSEEPKALVVSASINSTSTDNSPAYSDSMYSPSQPFDFSFADIPDSFSTSIAEKVKTRTRNRTSSSEPVVHNFIDKKPVNETVVKKIKKSPAEESTPLRKNSPCLSPKSVSYHINKTKEAIQKKLWAIKNLTEKNNSAKQVNNVPSLSLIPCNDVLGITDNFISKSKRTVINNNVIASKIKNFHDYSKSIPVNNIVVKPEKELNHSNLQLVSNECKPVTLRSDTNHATTKLRARKTSGEYVDIISSTQEFSDVPVSMAEVEIASFEDVSSDIPSGNKSPYSLRNSHISDSSPKKPVVLLTPISSKRLLNSENMRNRHCSTESENSSHGYHSADSLSPAQTANLFRTRRSGLKSNFETNPQSDLMCNSKVNSLHDKFDCDVSMDGNYDHFQSPQAKTRRISRLSESPKKEVYPSNTLFTLRPSTRSQTKSPERPIQLTKLKRESRSQYSDDKRQENDSRKIPVDNRKAIEERRVMYVGKIPIGFTEEILQQRFSVFGEIENIQIKVRESEAQNDCGSVVDHEYGDWSLMSSSNGMDRWKKMYGFVTFKKHSDVARAIEEGQKWWPELKLNFGGRREFVKVNYSDLDGNFAEKTGYSYGYSPKKDDDFDFARELKAAQQRRGLAYK
ncbi:peroxisome proliferator-activated receptor gamma coactivator 1-alpha isoform X5 [Parasteatoda tepidariorum]|uniref:peroxisome proliferator-activated receptor gamma coactivator 1-alpha isoform X5 n=1 Tax=Parasteatoda tepidariorum TaxID=114398 RepID=UPI0039BD7FAE